MRRTTLTITPRRQRTSHYHASIAVRYSKDPLNLTLLTLNLTLLTITLLSIDLLTVTLSLTLTYCL